jgi:hypothetical protein
MPLSAVADTFVFRDRFLEILEAFVGTLPEEQVERLRAWIHQDGVPAVWRELEGSFRGGPQAVRRCLEERWAGERHGPPRPDPVVDEEAQDA